MMGSNMSNERSYKHFSLDLCYLAAVICTGPFSSVLSPPEAASYFSLLHILLSTGFSKGFITKSCSPADADAEIITIRLMNSAT